MCGRYNLEYTAAIDKLLSQHGFQGEFKPAYNIAPTDFAPIIIQDRHRPSEIIPARWWLTPSWSSGLSQKFSMFNARAENLLTSRAFKGPFQHKRCIVPASGFIEWHRKEKEKQPYLVELDGKGLAMAGIWDYWQDGENVLFSFAIITKPASPSFQTLHSRMPVLLKEEDLSTWLDPHTTAKQALPLIDTSISHGWQMTPIDNSIGHSKNKTKPQVSDIQSIVN